MPARTSSVVSLCRTRQTAGPLAATQGLITRVHGGICEVEAGALESRSDESSINIYKATFIAWADGDLDAANPGGETGWQAFARFNSVLVDAFDAAFRRVAVVSSGAMLRSWAGYHCDNIEAGFWGAFFTEHRHHRGNGEPSAWMDSKKLDWQTCCGILTRWTIFRRTCGRTEK